MNKQHTFIILTLSGFFLLIAGIASVYNQSAWLEERRLSGSAFILLIMLGIFALLKPLELRQKYDQLTPQQMVEQYLTRLTLLIIGVTGILLLFRIILYLIALPTILGRPEFTLIWLTLLIPLGISLSDLYQGKYARTPAKFALSFALQTWQIYGQLIIIIPLALGAFALFPAGLCLQLLSGVDLVGHLLSEPSLSSSTPLLCDQLNLGEDSCVPALVGFHVGHPVLAGLAIYFGEQGFNKLVGWYAISLTWLAARLQA